MAGLLFVTLGMGMDRLMEKREKKKQDRRKALLEAYYPPLPTSEAEARERIARRRHSRSKRHRDVEHHPAPAYSPHHYQPSASSRPDHPMARRSSEPGRFENDYLNAAELSESRLAVSPADFDREMEGEGSGYGSEKEGETARERNGAYPDEAPPSYEEVVGDHGHGHGQGHGRMGEPAPQR